MFRPMNYQSSLLYVVIMFLSLTPLQLRAATELSSVDATRIVIKKTQVLDEGMGRTSAGISLSQDETKLLYGKPQGKTMELVIKSLETGQTVRRISIPYPSKGVAGTAWSPDGGRIAYCAYKAEIGLSTVLTIHDMRTGKNVNLPDQIHLCTYKYMSWPEESNIYFKKEKLFDTKKDPQHILNLDTLQFKSPYGSFYTPPQKLSKHRTAYIFFRDSRPYKRNLIVANRDGSFFRLLVDYHCCRGDEFAITSDLQFIVHRTYSKLNLLRLGARDKPKLTFRIEFGRSQLLKWLEAHKTKRYKHLAKKELAEVEGKRFPVYGEVYESKLNPLNGKVIGPDVAKYKGQVKLERLLNTSAIVTSYYEKIAIKEGDIIGKIYSSKPGGSSLAVGIEGSNLWWVLRG